MEAASWPPLSLRTAAEGVLVGAITACYRTRCHTAAAPALVLRDCVLTAEGSLSGEGGLSGKLGGDTRTRQEGHVDTASRRVRIRPAAPLAGRLHARKRNAHRYQS